MAIERKDIEHIAKLARLDINGENFENLANDMQGIVEMVDKLQTLNLDDITDTIDSERKNAFHDDIPFQEFTPENLIAPNAPDFQAGGIAVPRVVE